MAGNKDHTQVISDGAQLMSKAFDYVMDKAEELTEDCQRKTEEI